MGGGRPGGDERRCNTMDGDCGSRESEILSDCGVRSPATRDLLRPLARQVAALEVDLSGRTAHDAEYLRLLKAYESALQTLRRSCR